MRKTSAKHTHVYNSAHTVIEVQTAERLLPSEKHSTSQPFYTSCTACSTGGRRGRQHLGDHSLQQISLQHMRSWLSCQPEALMHRPGPGQIVFWDAGPGQIVLWGTCISAPGLLGHTVTRVKSAHPCLRTTTSTGSGWIRRGFEVVLDLGGCIHDGGSQAVCWGCAIRLGLMGRRLASQLGHWSALSSA